MYFLTSIALWLLLPIIFIYGIAKLVGNFREKHSSQSDQDRDKHLAISPQDAISQWLLVLSPMLLTTAAFLINSEANNPLTWLHILGVGFVLQLGVAYIARSIASQLVGILGMVLWWISQSYKWVQDHDIQIMSIVSGVVLIFGILYLLGGLHERLKSFYRFNHIYRSLGIIGSTLVLFFLSTKSGLSFFTAWTRDAPFWHAWQLGLMLGLFITAGIALASISIIQKTISVAEASILAVLIGVCVVPLWLPHQITSNTYLAIGQGAPTLTTVGYIWATIFNLLIFIQTVALILLGYTNKQLWIINIGTLFLFILICIKYTDWFFDTLDRGIFFIGAGLILFFIGWIIEKGRRYVVSTIPTSEGNHASI